MQIHSLALRSLPAILARHRAMIAAVFLLSGAGVAEAAVPAVDASFNPYCQGRNRVAMFRCRLAVAQQTGNLPQITEITQALTLALGGQAGVPDEAPATYTIDFDAPALSVGQIGAAFEPYRKQVVRNAWWLSRPAPTGIAHPLRDVASIITGALAARDAGAESAEQLLSIAESAADYLLWAQAQGGQGLFPFPAVRRNKGRAFEAAEKFLKRAEELGMLPTAVSNDWIINDLGNGDLQFDNGLCGVAMIELHRATRKEKYLQSAIAAANWAIAQPVVPNWNYNSFSIHLLASLYAQTGDARYLRHAKLKARLGLYPGQLKAGARQGRWVDPHNARLVYHYVMIRSLGALVAVLPQDDPDLTQAREVLSMALAAGNAEIISRGVAHPSTVLETLAQLSLLFPPSSSTLPDLGRAQAFDLLARHASSGFFAGRLPVDPGAWGLYLKALRMSGAPIEGSLNLPARRPGGTR
ncbi:hypothetical protein SAMN06265795_10890 [Noviherbaspirillum humi]|uniref:Alginate lyase n=2 Tax=Noviherbaspirillum humi TaxID=1688639 RepID=A0A239I2U2_9BURK|nr:hypothetical protein SAMN06265795_10890 [Noviherbaspirillum humi]